MECIQCGEELSEGKWCTLGCKERFYIENYLGSELVKSLEHWHDVKHKIDSDKAIKEFNAWQEKNPGKGFVEYLLSLGDFIES